MKLLIVGNNHYFITDTEANDIIKTIEQDCVAFISRLDNLMVSKFSIKYFGPVDQSFVGKEIYADADGVLYHKDGAKWMFWHNFSAYDRSRNKIELRKEELEKLMLGNKRVNKSVDSKYQPMRMDWVPVGDSDEIAVIPVDQYLKWKISEPRALTELKSMERLSVGNKDLPTVISGDVFIIGRDKRLRREEKQKKFNESFIEQYKKMGESDKLLAFESLKDNNFTSFNIIKKDLEDIFYDAHKMNIYDYVEMFNKTKFSDFQ